MRIPDTGQISDLICSCKNEASALRAVWGAYRESGSLRSCNGMERRRASARCARQYPAAERSSQKTYKPRAQGVSPAGLAFASKAAETVPLLFLISLISLFLFPPFFSLIFGNSAGYRSYPTELPNLIPAFSQRQRFRARSGPRTLPRSFFCPILRRRFVQNVTEIYKKPDCISESIVLNCTRGNIRVDQKPYRHI